MLIVTQSVQSSHRLVRLNDLDQPRSDFQLIKLFLAAGAILPLVLFSLETSTSYLCANGPLGWFRTLVWPTSILTMGTQCSHFTLARFYSVLLNIPFYLVLGSLVWLGLQPPRSTVYLTFIGMMYLTIVGVAEFWAWLPT
jgi:hypothetical protein